MRIIFFGMTGQFSVPPLEALLSTNVDVCAVVVPADRLTAKATPHRMESSSSADSKLPIVDPYVNRNIVQLGWTHNIPAWEVSSLSDSQTMRLLSSLQPDLIVVACFPYIFPAALLQLPRYGCLNLHPSLLPAYRGPVPLFWIARNDERTTGVTLHFLDEGVDSGDIVLQTSFDRPDGISGAELDLKCAKEGAKLLLTAVQQFEQGTLSSRPQVEINASYHPQPCEEDFVIPTAWSARRASNFLRGAEDWPLVIEVDDMQFSVRVAKSYSTEHTLDQPYTLLGDELWVQFKPGVLRARVYV